VSRDIGKFWISCALVILAVLLSSFIYKSTPTSTHEVNGLWTIYVMDALIDYISILALIVINPYNRFNVLMCIILSAGIAGHVVGGFLFHYSSSTMAVDYITYYRNIIMASQILLMLWTIYQNDLLSRTWTYISSLYKPSVSADNFKDNSAYKEG
jgi:hypothetical protein